MAFSDCQQTLGPHLVDANGNPLPAQLQAALLTLATEESGCTSQNFTQNNNPFSIGPLWSFPSLSAAVQDFINRYQTQIGYYQQSGYDINTFLNGLLGTGYAGSESVNGGTPTVNNAPSANPNFLPNFLNLWHTIGGNPGNPSTAGIALSGNTSGGSQDSSSQSSGCSEANVPVVGPLICWVNQWAAQAGVFVLGIVILLGGLLILGLSNNSVRQAVTAGAGAAAGGPEGAALAGGSRARHIGRAVGSRLQRKPEPKRETSHERGRLVNRERAREVLTQMRAKRERS